MTVQKADRHPAAPLFDGWEETLIWSCLDGSMGEICMTEDGHSARASINCFHFFAGEPAKELITGLPDAFRILVPQNEGWEKAIEEAEPRAEKQLRYAIRKDTVFDRRHLTALTAQIPEGYSLHPIDAALFEECRRHEFSEDFVSSFRDAEDYLAHGLGMVILKDGQPAAGASSFSYYRGGIEIEVDTDVPHRRKHLAQAACAALILECLDRGLYPSWDAANPASVRLSESLGYTLSHEYYAYILKAGMEGEGRAETV